MKTNRLSSLSPAFFLISDLISLNIAFFSAVIYRFDQNTPLESVYYDYYVQLYILLHAVWIAFYLHSYNQRLYSNFTDISNSFNKRWLLLIVVYLLMIVSLKGYYYSRIFALIFFTVLLFIGNIFILITAWFTTRYITPNQLPKILVIGATKDVFSVKIKLISEGEKSSEIIPIITDSPETFLDQYHEQDFSMVISIYRNSDAIVNVQNWCDKSYIPHYIALYEFADLTFSADVFQKSGIQLLKMRDEPLANPLNKVLKRSFDIIVSLVLISILFIPSILLSLSLYLYWKKSPIFCQKRYGLVGKIFTMYKFRTIDGEKCPLFCRFLRKFSIDEWPQIINILKGDMSLIGPRPYHLSDVDLFKKKSKKFMVRHWVKPGITGLAQIRGYRGKINNEKHYHERLKNDVWYIENWSLTLDIKILILSLFRILKGDGV
ncbi:MAG: sugar transferase [Thermaurantimonas sp.]